MECWIRYHFLSWIRIRIQYEDPDPDPGGENLRERTEISAWKMEENCTGNLIIKY